MKDRLIVTEINYALRIAWYLADDEEIGTVLGEDRRSLKPPGKNAEADAFEHYAATMVAAESKGVMSDDNGFLWESKRETVNALKKIKTVLKGMREKKAASIKKCPTCNGCGWVNK